MLTFSDIHKSYTSGSKTTEILKGISFSLSKGETISITGRSGSGKSTILNLIAGLDFPDSGEITFESKKTSSRSSDELSDFRLHSIGLIFQFFNFLPSLSIQQNVAIPGYLSGKTGSDTRKRTYECLRLLQIEHLAERLPHEVSGGELQRAAIARALFMKPQMLLADEPTGNLDKENATHVFSLFMDIVRETGSSLVLVTHDKALAAKTERALHLEDGKLLA